MRFLIIILFTLYSQFLQSAAPAIRSTPLIDAVTHGAYDRAQSLLKSGIDVNERDNEGNTATMRVVSEPQRSNSLPILELLLQYKPNLDIENNDHESALMIAAKNNHSEIFDLLFPHIIIPKKCCFLTFEQDDPKRVIATGLYQSLLMKIVSITTPHILKKSFERYPFIQECCTAGKFVLLADDAENLIVIIPESLKKLQKTLSEAVIQNGIAAHIMDKYGFKNLHLLNPGTIPSLIVKKVNEIDIRLLLQTLEKIINLRNAYLTRFYLAGHGAAQHTIASIPVSSLLYFLSFLTLINADFLYINSCYAAGTNIVILQKSLEQLVAAQIGSKDKLNKSYHVLLQEYENSMRERMAAEPKKYPDIETYNKFYPAPKQYFAGINYAIAIHATSGTITGEFGNLKAMFLKLNEFLKAPVWVLDFGPGVEKPKITISDVFSALELKKAYALPSIRLPGKEQLFRSINIGNMEIITESRLIEEGVQKTLKLITESKSPDRPIAVAAQKKLALPLGIEFYIKPDIQFIQIFPIDLSDFVFIIEGDNIPKFISKLVNTGHHFIGGINCHGSLLKNFINAAFISVFDLFQKSPAETPRCWFIKSVDLNYRGLKLHIKKLAIKCDPAPVGKLGAYIGSFAYISQNRTYTSEKGSDAVEIDKNTFEATIRKWFQETIPSQQTLTEATGGVEITAQEKARLEKEKGGAQALRLLEPRFARTPEDLFNIFMAD